MRSLYFCSQATVFDSHCCVTGEAEAGSGGDQPARGIASRSLVETMDRGVVFYLRPGAVLFPIGSKDLPMPEKTHLRRVREALAQLAFILLRRPVAQRRVQPAAVVVTLQEVRDPAAQIVQVAVPLA